VRSGAAAGHTGFFHQAAFYGSDEEFLAIVVPFLRGGVEAGEPTLVALAEKNAGLVRTALAGAAELDAIRFLPGANQYARPASAIRSYREMFEDWTARGARQIRVVGDVPHPGVGAPWTGWARYEAAVNRAYDPFPMWGVCPYDTRTTPPAVLADVAATHPLVATASAESLTNPDFTDPELFLTDQISGRPLPEGAPPAVDLPDVTPPQAREVARAVAAARRLGVDATDDLALAVSEAVTNAHAHGVPPARLRLWDDHPDRVVAAVTDHGGGPRDPYVGLLPTAGSRSAGLGLWMAHLMCTEVTMHLAGDGFTIRVVVAAG
jgi:anti-sigma regulatory factor (Ser/Thr protein kinase)